MLFCKLQAGFRVTFTEERLPSGHSAIKPRSVECCSDDCPSGSFSHLHTGSLELSQSDHRVLGHLSYQGPSPPIAQFGWTASSRKTLQALFTNCLKNSEGHRNLQCSSFFLAFPRPVPWHNPVSELCKQFLWPHGLVLLRYALSAETIYRQMCAFPNHVHWIEFTTYGLQSRCRNTSKIQENWEAPEVNCVIENGLNTYVNVIFQFFLFNKFAKCSKILCYYGVLSVDWWGKQ